MVWSDAGGRLSGRLLFTAPQTSRLFFVADAHLLRDVHQGAGHGQPCAHTPVRNLSLVESRSDGPGASLKDPFVSSTRRSNLQKQLVSH